MAKVEITEEEANEAYIEGYTEGRGSSDFLEDIADSIMSDIEEVTEGIVDAALFVLTFGLFGDGTDEKEARLQEIRDAGYQRGLEDKEKYGERD